MVGEIYEIKPIRFLPQPGKEIAEGAEQLFQYYVSLNMVAFFGGLRGQIPNDGRPNRNPNPLTGQIWDFNTIRWRPGASMPPGPHTVYLRGQGPLWVIRPVPGLILYADDTTRLQAQTVLGTVITLATLPKIVEGLMEQWGGVIPNPGLQPIPITPPLIMPNPDYFICQQYPYAPQCPQDNIKS
jgi:hypothetical protein